MADFKVDPRNPDHAAWAENLTYGRVYSKLKGSALESEWTATLQCEAYVQPALQKEIDDKLQARNAALWRLSRQRDALRGSLDRINRALGNQDLLQDSVDIATATAGTALGLVGITGLAVLSAPVTITAGVVLGGLSLANNVLRPDVDPVLTGAQAGADVLGTALPVAQVTGPLAQVGNAAPFASAGLGVYSAISSTLPALDYSAQSVTQLNNLRAQIDSLEATKIRELFGLDKQSTLDEIDKTIEAEEDFQEAQRAYAATGGGRALAESMSTCIEQLSAELRKPKPIPRRRPGG
ncbi:MAG: hypothetical protein R3B70_17310 [Polyangiaceae bacterium]